MSLELVENSHISAVSYTMLQEQVIKIKRKIGSEAVLRIKSNLVLTKCIILEVSIRVSEETEY